MKISKEILEEYEVVTPFVKQRLSNHLGGGIIYANTITLEKVNELVSKGWDYLKKKPKKAVKKPKETDIE